MRIWVLHIARLVLLSAFLISCNEEEGASYPPVKLEFLTAEAGADGTLQTLVTDKESVWWWQKTAPDGIIPEWK